MEAINDTIQQAINSTQSIKSPLQPYDENFRLLRNVKENIPLVLQIGFTWSSFDNYLSSLRKWLQAAIGNEMSAYEKGLRRIDLLKFHDSILLLLEALNAINETNKIVEQTGNQQQKSLAESNLSIPPRIVIQEFCRSYTWEYCRMELWDWLDAANSNDAFYSAGLGRSFLLIEYQCIHGLIEAAYLLNSENEEKILQSEEGENIETKVGSEALIMIRHFFLNTPLKKATSTIQEFYSAWVHSMATIAASDEHSDKLLFCEYLSKLFSELHDLTGLTKNIQTTARN